MSDRQDAGPGPRAWERGVSADTRAMMMYEANKKSTLIAYLLWFFLGFLGGHRFYMQKTGSGAVQLIMFLVGMILSVVLVGFLILLPLVIWVIVDAFLIPGWINAYNSYLAYRLGEE